MTIRFWLGSVTTLACLGFAATTDAQNALGAGDALDANPAVGTDGRNPRGPVEDFRARNLIVTGDVAGGRGFRGSVGYTAERDFRGLAGSDDLYRFRSNAAYSSPAAILSGISSARLYGDVNAEYRRDTTPRIVAEPQMNPDRWLPRADTRVAVDRLNVGTALRGTQMVGLVQDGQQHLLSFSASSVRGVEAAPAEEDTMALGLSFMDRVRLRQDITQGRVSEFPGTPFNARVETRVESEASDTSAASNRVDEVPSSYESILNRVIKSPTSSAVEPGASEAPQDETPAAKAQRELDELRRRLGGVDVPEEQKPKDSKDGQKSEGDEDPKDKPDARSTSDRRIEDYASMLRHGSELRTLTEPEQTRLNELVSQGETLLKAGRYFDAEERFQRALRVQPGHPLAMAGLAHAEIGAGLNLSASITLRSLFVEHPEMIDVQYDRSLLPADDRLAAATASIRDRMTTDDPAAARIALLMAYLGRQTGSSERIKEGLDRLATLPTEQELAALLRSVWLENAPVPVPAAQQPAPQDPQK